MRKERNNAVSDGKLKEKLLSIILLESSKPYKEMDSALVSECVDFLMDIEDTERLTEEERRERIDSIPFDSKVTDFKKRQKLKVRTKRIIIIAAVLALIFTLSALVAVSFSSPEDSLYDRYAHYFNEVMKPGEHKNFGNIEVIKHNDSAVFSSVEEFLEHEKMEILFPTWLPEEKTVTEINWYYEEVDGEYYVLDCGNPIYSVTINIDKTVSDEIKATQPSREIGEHTVYIIYTEDFIQGMFEYKGSYYAVCAYSEEDVVKIIENLIVVK